MDEQHQESFNEQLIRLSKSTPTGKRGVKLSNLGTILVHSIGPAEPPKSESQEIMVDKDRFDAVLRRMAASKPLPVKDLTGTFPRKPKGKA